MKNKLNHKDIDKVFTELYEYWSELHILNANKALKLFNTDFNNKYQYYILAGGLGQIIELLEKHIGKHTHSKIINNYFVKDVSKKTEKGKQIYVIDNKFKCSNIIFCIPKHNLKSINILKNNASLVKKLNCVTEQPLYRIYAKYPKNKDGNVWFKDMGKVTTNLPLKYIIPIDYNTGLIMISYTDGKYAKQLFNSIHNSSNNANDIIHKNLKTFPDMTIPKPKWLKHHYWHDGAAYWKTGCDSSKLMKEIINPLDNIYICGENYSNHQAWIEGALETSEMVIDKILNTKY